MKYDPALTTILDKPELASQPTMSRVNQHFDKYTMKQFQEVSKTVIDRFHEIETPKIFVLDIDSSNSSTYGNQFDSAYIFHYGENDCHPIFMLDGETGDCLKTSLCADKVYKSRKIVFFLGPELKRLKKEYSHIKIFIRQGSGFATPESYKFCDELGASA